MNQPEASRPLVLPDIRAEALREILDVSSDGICIVVPEPWRVAYANATMQRHLAAASQPWQGRPLGDVWPTFTSAHVQQLDRIQRGEVEETVLAGECASPGSEPTEIHLRRITLGSQAAVVIVVRPAAAPGSPRGADVDSLTGLASRSFLMSRIEKLLHGERAADEQIAVLFIDMNDFKWINDTYGHLVGDRALCEVARRLATCIRAGDHIARFGGDEFVVLLEHVDDEKEIQPVLDRIHAVLRQPIALPAGEATITASIGVATASPARRTAEELLAAADLAMYASKRQ